MKNARRTNFISFFGFLFPVSDTMAVKCWRATRTALSDEELEDLLAGLREAVIAKAHMAKRATPLSGRPEDGQ